jgi:hypothetical protein
MRFLTGRCLTVFLLLLALNAAAASAQTSAQPVKSLPGDPFASGFQATTSGKSLLGDPFSAPGKKGSATKEVQGDPFATKPGKDPFAAQNLFDLKTGEAKAGDASQGQFSLHGYLETRNRVRIKNPEAISQRQRIWLESEAILYPSEEPGGNHPLRLFASGALDFDPAASDLSDDVTLWELYAEEAFLTLDTDSIDVILGRKLFRMGTGDGINPLDLINPIDHRDPLATGRADSRLPVLLGMGLVPLPTFGLLQEASIEAVVVPFPQVNQLNEPGSPWEGRGLKILRQAAAQGQLILDDQEKPSQSLQNAEFALRLAATLSGWDLALIGYCGHMKSPVFARSLSASPQGEDILRIIPIHPNFAAVGFNFAKGLERSTIRGELSLKPNLPVMLEDMTSLPGYTRRSVWEGVLGWDRTFGTNLYVNLQYFCTALGDAGEVDGLVMDRLEHGLSYEIHDLFLQDALTAGVRGIASFSGEGYTFELYGEYELTDNILLAASLLFFEGPESGQYGQFDDNDSFTVRLRYSF